MDYSQKLISEFMNLGNVDHKAANVALQVYLELCEVKKYWDVEYKYDDELQLIYITAKKSKSDNISIFVPKYANEDLSFIKIQDYFRISLNYQISSVFLVFVTSDSTCVYYQVTEGLAVPSEINVKRLTVNKQEQRDANIRKHRSLIEQAALCGVPITLRETKS